MYVNDRELTQLKGAYKIILYVLGGNRCTGLLVLAEKILYYVDTVDGGICFITSLKNKELDFMI